MNFSRGQGSLEYLLVVGVVILVTSVVIVGLSGVVGSSQDREINSNDALNPLKQMAGGAITILDIADSFGDSDGDLVFSLDNQSSSAIDVTEVIITFGGATTTRIYSSGSSLPAKQVTPIFVDTSSCVCPQGSSFVVCQVELHFSNGLIIQKDETVSCTDDVGPDGSIIPSDTSPPIVELISPSAGETISSFDFTFSVNDMSIISACDLIIDGVVRESIDSPQKNSPITFTYWNDDVTPSHTWGISCTDFNQNQSSSSLSFTNPFTSFSRISACPATISSPNSYNYITQNISFAGTCITISANNVAIDGRGNTITGNISGNGVTDGQNGYSFSLNNITVSGNVTSNGRRGKTNFFLDGQAGGNGGSLKINNSTISFLIVNGGWGGDGGTYDSGGLGGSSGSLLIKDSIITTINSYGGAGGDAYIAANGGNSGTVNIFDSQISTLSCLGGYGAYSIDNGPDGFGGSSGLITITDSSVSSVTSNGGDNWGEYSRTSAGGGSSGGIIFTNVSSINSIVAKGGNSTGSKAGPGGNGGNIVFDSCPSPLPSIDVFGGVGVPAGNSGTITPAC